MYRYIGGGRRWVHSTEVALWLLTQRPWVQFSAFPKTSFDVAETYWRHWLEESDQRRADQAVLLERCRRYRHYMTTEKSFFSEDNNCRHYKIDSEIKMLIW